MTVLLAVLATVAGNGAFAQTNPSQGQAAAESSRATSGFAWGIGLGVLAVVGVIVGVTVASATDSPSSFSH